MNLAQWANNPALWQQRILRGADECQARALFGQFLSALSEYGCEA